MLNLQDPVEIEGLVIFRADDDPRKFFLLPDDPVIPLDDHGAPDFLFIRYIKDLETTAEGEDDGAGFVQFRTALTLDPDRRARVLDHLRVRLVEEQAAGTKPFGLPIVNTEPLLAAPVWTDGSVNLVTFAVSDTGLVRKATESAPVDLTGDLSAMLAVQLDDDGAEVFWTAFEGRENQHIPISVQFDLGYKARISNRMEIHAKRDVIHREILQWARPYRLFAGRYCAIPGITGFVGGAQLATLRTQFVEPIRLCLPQWQVSKVINEKITDHTIEVTITTDLTEGGEDAVKLQESLFTIASDLLTERIVPAMFGGGGLPGADSPDSTTNTPLVGVDEDGPDGDLAFDMVFDHSATIERRIHPNGPVQLMIGSDAALESCFTTLRLSDRALAATQILASTVGVTFADDGIAAVHVFLSYEHTDESDPGKPVIKRQTDGVLTKPDDVVRWRFDLARDKTGRHLRDYRYKVDVLYTDGRTTESVWQTSTARSLLLTPAALGAIKVDVVLTAPPEQVDAATVELRYTPPAVAGAPATGTAPLTATLQLSPTANRQTWFQYTGEVADVPGDVAGGTGTVRDLRQPPYEYRIRYRVRGTEVQTDWATSTARLLEVGVPFAKMLTYVIRPQGSFEGVASVSGDLVYTDSARAYTVTEPFELTSLTASHAVTIGVFPGGPETVEWRARLTRTDGSGATLGPGGSGPGTVWVGTDVDFLRIRIEPALLDFATDLKLALVTVHYTDTAHEIDERRTFTFSATANEAIEWQVARSDRANSRYDAHIRYLAIDPAKNTEVDLPQIDDQVLLLEHR